jgi:hypothetical protein
LIFVAGIQQIPQQTVPGAVVGVCNLINLPCEVLRGTAEQSQSFLFDSCCWRASVFIFTLGFHSLFARFKLEEQIATFGVVPVFEQGIANR